MSVFESVNPFQFGALTSYQLMEQLMLRFDSKLYIDGNRFKI